MKEYIIILSCLYNAKGKVIVTFRDLVKEIGVNDIETILKYLSDKRYIEFYPIPFASIDERGIGTLFNDSSTFKILPDGEIFLEKENREKETLFYAKWAMIVSAISGGITILLWLLNTGVICR